MIAAKDASSGFLHSLFRFFTNGGDQAAKPRLAIAKVDDQLIALRKTSQELASMGWLQRWFSADDMAIIKVQIGFLEKQKETLAALAALPKNGPSPGADPGAAAAAAKKAAAFLGSEAAGKDGGFNLGKALQEGMDVEAKTMAEASQLSDDFRAKERAAEKASYDDRNKALIDFYDRGQAVAIENGAKQIAIDKAIADQKKAQQESEFQGRMTFLQNLAGLMNTHSKRAFEVGKAAALVQAGVSGALAVMEAWRSGMQTLGPWAPAVAAAYAAAAAANALNLMNNIRKQTFGGGGGASPVFSAQPGTSIPAAAQAAAPAAQSPGQTTVVNFPEGMRDDDLFSGKMMRAFFKNLEEGTRNGGRVVFS